MARNILRRSLRGFFVGSALMVVACGGGGGGGGSSSVILPAVTEVRPAAAATAVPVMTTVSVEFNKSVDPSTLQGGSFTLSSPTGVVSGTVVCSGTTATFIPSAPLAFNTAYTAGVSTEVRDLTGNRLAAPFTATFTTAADAPGDPADYLPFAVGRTWNFQGTASAPGMAPFSYSNSLSITGTQTVAGKTATLFAESNAGNDGPDGSYLVKDGYGITYYGSSDPTDVFTQQLVPYQEMNFPAFPGYSFVQVHKAGFDFGIDLDGDNVNETADIVSTRTVVGLEAVTVPAGSFADCLHLRTEVRITVRASVDRLAYQFRSLDDQWYAPGVGPVKTTNVFTNPDGTQESVVEELVNTFTILAQNLATADSDTESPGRPSVGSDGTNFLVVSRRVESFFSSTMVGLLVNKHNEVLSTFDIAAADSGGFLSSNRSAVAFGQGNYLVVFGRNGQIAGQRISAAGAPLDGPDGFAVTATGSNSRPAVAFDGVNFLAVWEKYQTDDDIYAALISPAGQVLAEFPVFAGAGEQIAPGIVFDGSNYLVAWQDSRNSSGPGDNTDIYAARVTPAGVVLDPAGIPVCTAPGYQGVPVLTLGGGNAFAAWEDGRAFAGTLGQLPGVDIYGARLGSDGTVLDAGGIPINTTAYMAFNGKAYPTAAFDGSNYFVAWQTGSYPNFPPAGIFAQRVSPAGAVLDLGAGPDGRSMSGPPGTAAKYFYPVAAAAGGETLLVWMSEAKDLRAVVVPTP